METPLDVLLINAHRRYLNFEPRYGGFLGVFLLSAFLRQEGYNVKGYTGTLIKSIEKTDELCGKNNLYMVGLYCDYENVTENIKLCRHIKEKYGLPVVVGGPQGTTLNEDFFEKSGCDAVCRYEGELTLLELANYFLEGAGSLDKISGIAYMDRGRLRINSERSPIVNLDNLPFIDETCYLEPELFYRGLSVMTGRGCPFSCAFCHEGAHTKSVRLRSVENVLAEIDAYFEKNPRDNIYVLFTDDTLTLKSKRLHKLCEGLAERQKQRPFKWFCEAHVHTLYMNPEMAKDLAMAGCARVQLGIEAGTDFALSAYGKRCTTKEIFEVVKLLRDAGIPQIYGNIILGGAHFSREIFEQDKIFVQKLIKESQGTLEIGVVSFWPLANTKMTTNPDEYGISICDYDFVTSAGDFPQTETKELSRLDIAKMQLEMEQMIDSLMKNMLKNWEVPMQRILSWFENSNYREGRGAWYLLLSKDEVLYSYFESLYFKEGFHSSQISDLSEAHPLRIQPLYRYIKNLEKGEYEILGFKFKEEDLEIIALSAGKLSVGEIVSHTKKGEDAVMNILNALESKHFIVYTI